VTFSISEPNFSCEYSRSAYSQAVVRSLIRGFFTLIFHWLFLIVLILSVGGTIACHYLSIYSDVPLTLLASALLFPISFGFVSKSFFMCIDGMKTEPNQKETLPQKLTSTCCFAVTLKYEYCNIVDFVLKWQMIVQNYCRLRVLCSFL
jgi:hypothetical protein